MSREAEETWQRCGDGSDTMMASVTSHPRTASGEGRGIPPREASEGCAR
jgi:hypothetical protein